MTTWRMSFRVGNQGTPMWLTCLNYGVAAITYEPLAKIDLSNFPEYEPRKLWNKLESTQKRSLHRVAYEMKPGDVIYVKEGPKIIGKGVVKGPYRFDTEFKIIDENNVPWSHQVPVKWESDFPEISIKLGAEQLTVKELSIDNLNKIDTVIQQAKENYKQMEVLEGEAYIKEATFRSRNRAVIQAKKVSSNYLCEICGFSFEQKYGKLGREYIVAHHIKPISSGISKTKFEDIALICANCHAMIHKKNPHISIKELRDIVLRNSK